MRVLLRILIWSAVAVALVFVAAAVTLYVLYPKQRIIEELVPRVEAAVARPVALADAGISVWPPFGLYVEGLVIENRSPATTPHLLRVGRARAQVRLWPLLHGQIYVDELELNDLEFTYETFDDTLTNISDLIGGEGGGLPLLAEHMVWSGITLRGIHHDDSSTWTVEDLSGYITMHPADTSFELGISLPRAEWLSLDDTLQFDYALELEADGTAHLESQQANLTRVQGTLAGIPLLGTAQVGLGDSGPVARGTLTLGPTGLADLLSELELELDTLFREYSVSGQVRLDIELDGSLAELTTGSTRAELVWLGGRVDRGTTEVVRFASLAVPVTAGGFHVSAKDLFLFDSPVDLGLVGSWPPSDRIELTLAGRTDLDGWSTDSVILGGAVEWSASARGPLQSPDRWRVRARATPRAVRYAYLDRQPLLVDGGSVMYDGKSIDLADLLLGTGPSRLSMSMNVAPVPWSVLMQGAWPDSTFAELDLRSSFLDLDALFPDLAGDSAAPSDTSTPPFVPATYAHVSLSADTLVAGGATWRNVQGEAQINQDSLHIERMQGRVYGGRAAISGAMELADPGGYRFDVRVDSVALGDALARFGRAARYLEGRGSLEASIAGHGFTWEQLLSELVVDGGAILFDAQLVNLPAARATHQLLGLEIADPLPLASRWSSFRVDRGRLAMDDFQLTTPDAQWILAGSAGLDGTLDYNLDGLLSRAKSAQVRLPESARNLFPAAWRDRIDPVELMKNDDGELELYIHVGGTLQKPAVELDWRRMEPVIKQRLEKRVTDELKKQLDDELKKGLEGLFDRLKR